MECLSMKIVATLDLTTGTSF